MKITKDMKIDRLTVNYLATEATDEEWQEFLEEIAQPGLESDGFDMIDLEGLKRQEVLTKLGYY